jgi:murein DD-endopeptidase MepM/ murein hydrolase activator NlpD
MRAPSPNVVTLNFGATTPPYTANARHRGTDYSYSPDHSVYAVDDGEVQVVKWNGSTTEGNMIIQTSGNRRWAYCHLASFAVVNGHVQKGQKLGTMGATGQVKGAHLHLAMRIDGVLVDMTKYINEPFGDQGDDMTEDAWYQIFRGMTGRDPTQDEAHNQAYRDVNFLAATLWNNGSKQRYEDDKAGIQYVPVDQQVFVKK